MRKYSEFEAMFPTPIDPSAEVKYWAYNRGTVKEFSDEYSAKCHSVLVERYVPTKDERVQYNMAMCEWHDKVQAAWVNALREEFPLSDDEHDIIFNNAMELCINNDHAAAIYEAMYKFQRYMFRKINDKAERSYNLIRSLDRRSS